MTVDGTHVRSRLEGVSLSLAGRPILREISTAFTAGSMIAVVGPNGAGKSSLLRVLAGLVAPNAGRVLFDDRPVILGQLEPCVQFCQRVTLNPRLSTRLGDWLRLHWPQVQGRRGGVIRDPVYPVDLFVRHAKFRWIHTV